MTPHSLGKINVASGGTAVPVTTDDALRAAKILFHNKLGNAKVIVGTRAMVVSSEAGVIRELAAGESFSIESGGDACLYRLSDYMVDGTTNQGPWVTYWN